MKKFLLLFSFLLAVFSFAQNPLLFNNSWKISKILYQNVEYSNPTPLNAPEIYYENLTTFTNTMIKTSYINSSIGIIYSISNSQIVIGEMGGTLMGSPDINFHNFEGYYRNIFSNAPVPKTFDYSITDNGNNRYSLVLSDVSSGNKIYYNSINTELINTNWKISKIEWNGQTIQSPTINHSVDYSKFNGSLFISEFFNVTSTPISISDNSDSFTKIGYSTVTLAEYFDTNWENVRYFDQLNCSFYFDAPNNRIFNYQIINNDSFKTLIITDSVTGNKIYYQSNILATQDILKNKLKIYPNPTSDFIFIENVRTNSLVKIIDVSGKIVLEKKLSGNSIDVKSLSKGIYFIEIEGNKPLKFIKK